MAVTVALTIEVANFAYYKLSGTFTLLKVGFGVQDIFFEENPTYCSNFYADSRALEASFVLESNAKSCSINWLEHMAIHWDSRVDPKPLASTSWYDVG